MHFVIDSRQFTVAIAARPLILSGQPAKAKLDRVAGKIWISDQLPKHERRVALFHELRHCWIDAHGYASDVEADADQAAEMMDTVLEQYQQQGGDSVLESLEPLPQPGINKSSVGPLAMTSAHCGHCEAPIAIGSIPQTSPAWSADLGAWVIQRGILCAVCDRVTVWRETSSAEGMPLGAIVPYPPPRVLTGAEAAQWIEENQSVCRVQCVQ